MAEIKISALPTGTPQGTDLTPATDTTDTSSAPTGTTKKYTRSSELNFYLEAMGLTSYEAVRVATTGALTAVYANGVLGVGATLTNSGAMAALTLDGVAVATSDRVLVKNQAAPAQNGIYTVTTVGSGAVNWVLTRATDYDQAAEVIQFGVVLVNQGTINAGLLWQETGPGPFVMGTTDITFAQYASQSLPVLNADGQLIIGSSSGAPAAATLTAGTGVSISNGANSITINVSGGGLATVPIVGTSQVAAVNTTYIALNAAQTSLDLPAVFAVGDIIRLVGATANAGGWVVVAETGDTVRVLSSTTSAGGTVTSTAQAGECIELVCDVANTSWVTTSFVSTLLTTA